MRISGPDVVVHRDDLEEYEVHKLSAEASALSWDPGFVPSKLEVTPPIGNGQPFLLREYDDQKFVFSQGNGCLELTVYND